MAIEEFNNKERLKKIREESLNPLISKVTKNIDPRLDTAETKISGSFNEVTLDLNTKELEFNTHGGHVSSHIQLGHIIPDEFPGVTAIGTTGNAKDLNTLTFKDAEVTGAGTKGARVAYDWKKLVEGNQREVYGQVGGSSPEAIRTFQYRGDTSKIEVRSGVATLTIPKADPITAQVKEVKGEIKNIILAGDTEGCTVDNEILTINLKAGGGGVPLSSGNFVGFFDNLGELQSEVTNPLNGKSMAFIKDATFTTGTYYDAWMYVNNKWTEVPNDPGVTYEEVTVAGKQGVFSIKPSPYISIDSNGQLNLDRLAESAGFAGFFDSQAALEAAVPNPIPERSYGYIRMASGSWMGRRYVRNGSTGVQEWINTVPIGATAVVSKSSSGVDSTEIAYGFKANGMITIDHSTGLATIKDSSGSGGLIGVIEDAGGAGVDRPVEKLKFVRGNTYVEYYTSDKSMKIQPAQRVIEYDADFEDEHNDQDYKGNIFYDDKTNSWMGWATPAAAGAVGTKWTHIAHEGMSGQVKRLDMALPQKAPIVKGGTLGDDVQWEHTGWSYVDPVGKDDPSDLPDAIKQSGGYVQTYVKFIEGEKDIPQARMQTCYEDEDGGSQWVRRFDPNPTNPGDPSWKKWVRTSFSHKDLDDHNLDPDAHKESFKYYRASSMTATLVGFAQQTEGGSAGGVRAANCDLMFDSHASVKQGEDYMDVPYKGTFRVKANFAISGYKESEKEFPTGRWQAIVRIKNKTASQWRTVGQYYYDHLDKKSKFPIIDFETPSIEMDIEDQVIINLTFGGMGTVQTKHPDLYFVPIKTYLLIEDTGTKTGFYMCKTYSKHFSTVDSTGAVGIRVHHANISDPNTTIRVYGEKINKVPVQMTPV
ncbi:MAG: hypothetical protein ACRC6V_18435 [Bacteroidales bacterium]